jgi:hypothetical protein
MSAPDTWVPRQAAELVVLDKLRAQPSTITVRTGQTATFGTLTIGLKGCFTRPLDLPQNATAYVEVTDSRGTAPVFRGWIFSGMPGLMQYEHPIYGMRLLACR